MLWAAAALAIAPMQAPQRAAMGAYPIGGREITATVPADPGPLASAERVATFEGDKYLISPEGKIVRRFRFGGGWSEFREGYAEANAKLTPETPEWRVKAIVLPRNDLLDVDEKGVARQRWSIMERGEIDHVAESLARFASMAEAASRGRLRIKIEFEVDSDTAFQTVRKGSPAFGAEFLAWYLRPRLNGGFFDAEDKVYRGPFDSVFLIHGAFAGSMPRAVVNDMPVSSIAFYREGRAVGLERLSLSLFNAWADHLAYAARASGFASGTLAPRQIPTPAEQAQGLAELAVPEAVFSSGMWGQVFGREEASTEDLLARATASLEPKAWTDAAADPFAKLPRLQAEDLAVRAEAKGLNVIAGKEIRFEWDGIPNEAPGLPFAPDNVFEQGKEAAAVLHYAGGARQLTLADSPYAALFGAGMKARVLGWLTAGDRMFLVLDSPALPRNLPEAAMLELPGLEWKGVPASRIEAPLPQDDIAVELRSSAVPYRGNMVLTDAQDPERGAVLSIKTIGLVRFGEAQLMGQQGDAGLFDAQTLPYLSFWIKGQGAEPMSLILVPAGGGEARVIRLFGRWPVPAEAESEKAPSIALPSEGWTQVVLDLRKLGLSRVAGVVLASNEHVWAWQSRQAVPPVVFLTGLKVMKSAPGPESSLEQAPALVPSATSANPEERALFAAQAGEADSPALIALLKDPNEDIEINAARAFTRFKNAQADLALIELLRTSIQARPAEAALDALAFQGTPAAWEAIDRAVKVGPFDLTRAFAGRALAKKKDPKMVPSLSLLLTCRTWWGRMFAAQAIAAVAEGQQKRVLMTFLWETDPAVRLAATLGADTMMDDVANKILWGAVNDPSDEIRAASCLKLIQSGNAKYVQEGLKGVRDESVGMRRRLLEMLREKPLEATRPALRLAVADTSPSVRAAALRAFAVIPGPVKAEEVENTLNDPDPRVKAALEELKRAKGF